MRIGKYLQFSKMRPEAFNGNGSQIDRFPLAKESTDTDMVSDLYLCLQSAPAVHAE